MTTKRPTMLSEQDEKIAVARLMAGAQAHQRASVYCMDKPDAKPPNIDWFYFNVVSFELILMSVEHWIADHALALLPTAKEADKGQV